MKIHPTAIVDTNAVLAEGVEIGPYVIIGNDVKIGARTTVGPHTTIEGCTTIGEDCKIAQFATIGAAPQDMKYKGNPTAVEIGNGNIIREYVTIHRGTENGGRVTRIGDYNFLMAYTHIAHDCKIGNHVIFANCATLGGHVEIQDHAVLGGLVAVHQFSRIGGYAFVGGLSGIIKDIPPYVIASGERAKLFGINIIGLKRHNFSPEAIDALRSAYKLIVRSPLTLKEAVETAEREVLQVPEVQYFIDFIKNSKRGIPRK
ncbi:MAG: acyl-ACP--UDP-N-acetylglucosamine O-acyltransferase [Desulfovibrionales bacterium]|nr:acyl-ACP--UDP-N-acetylglucosamine O-acyltransferase [Desulfovibrionales bacterium]